MSHGSRLTILTLPSEIRLTICELVLTRFDQYGERIKYIRTMHPRMPWSRNGWPQWEHCALPKRSTCILRVCKQIAQETEDLLFKMYGLSCPCFLDNYNFDIALPDISLRQRLSLSNLAKLTIELGAFESLVPKNDMTEMHHWCAYICDNLQGLKKLTLYAQRETRFPLFGWPDPLTFGWSAKEIDNGIPFVEQRHLMYFAAFLTRGHPRLKLALMSERWKKTPEWSYMLNMIYHTFQVCTKVVLNPARQTPDLKGFDGAEVYDKLVDDISDTSDEDDDYVDEGYQGSAPDTDSTAGDDYVPDQATDDDLQPVTTHIDFGEDFVDRINNTVFVCSQDYFHNAPADYDPTNYEDDFPTIQQADIISGARDADFCLHLFDEDVAEQPSYIPKPMTEPYHRQHVILNSRAIRALSWVAFSETTREHFSGCPPWARKLDTFLMPRTATSSEEVPEDKL